MAELHAHPTESTTADNIIELNTFIRRCNQNLNDYRTKFESVIGQLGTRESIAEKRREQRRQLLSRLAEMEAQNRLELFQQM